MATRSEINSQVLHLVGVIRRDDHHRPSADRRRRVVAVLAEYAGEIDRQRYRKLFMAAGDPVVPQSGTHHELNALHRQY